MGFGMAIIDGMNYTVLTMVHGKNSSLPLSCMHAIYGVGGILAPYLVVYAPNYSWQVLALVHGSLGLTLLVRRLLYGKPKNWKAKVRGATNAAASEGGESQMKAGVPRRVMAGGLAFMLFMEAIEGAIGSWAFSFAVTDLGQPPIVAALFPATFYLAFTTCRMMCVVTLWYIDVNPPQVAHVCSWLTMLGCMLFQLGTSWVEKGTEEEPPEIPLKFLLMSIGLLAMGLAPQVTMMQASVALHGHLSPQQVGLYTLALNIGTTMGLWFPGVVSLPWAQSIWGGCAICILTAFYRDFPLRRKIGSAEA